MSINRISSCTIYWLLDLWGYLGTYPDVMSSRDSVSRYTSGCHGTHVAYSPVVTCYIYIHILTITYNFILVVTHFALVILKACIYDNVVSVRATVGARKMWPTPQ